MRHCTAALLLVGFIIILYAAIAAPKVNASPEPLNVAWLVMDSTGTPVDGAKLTIYWSTSTSGGFSPMDASIVEDKVATPNLFRNPIFTGYWNPTYPHGMAVADLHITHVSDYYFYAKIEYGALYCYWPISTSTKIGDPTWAPVPATGSPSGYAASGNGLGNGVTTAYLPPPPVIPAVPLGPLMSGLSMIIGLAAYVGIRKRITS